MATNAELYAQLQGMTPDSLLAMINYFTPAQEQSFIDEDRQKLLVKYSPNTAAGQAVRAMYRAIDAGNDPQAVLDDFTTKFDSGEFDRMVDTSGNTLGVLTPDDASEIVGAVSGTAIKRASAAKAQGTPLDVLKGLGLTELAPLLPALEQSRPVVPQSMTGPSTLSSTYESILARLAKKQEAQGAQAPKTGFTPEEAERLVRNAAGGGAAINVGGVLNALRGSGKKEFTQKDIESIIAPVEGVGSTDYQEDQKQRLIRAFALPAAKGGKKADDLQKQIAMAKKAQAQEKKFTEAASKATMDMIAQYEANRPKNSTPFDVTKALLMKASKSK